MTILIQPKQVMSNNVSLVKWKKRKRFSILLVTVFVSCDKEGEEGES